MSDAHLGSGSDADVTRELKAGWFRRKFGGDLKFGCELMAGHLVVVRTTWPNKGAAANRRPAGQSDVSYEFARDHCSPPGVSGGGR